jgi:hypothetical protein
MSKLKCSILILFVLILTTSTFAKTEKYDEMKFNLGFGGFVNTSNLMGLIEDVKMMSVVNGESSPNFPGLTAEQNQAFSNLSRGMKSAIMVANILGGMEYGLKMRVLYSVLIADLDFVLLPFDGSYNGRLDFNFNTNVGIRAPFWIMPYITFGANFLFSFYSPDDYTNVEQWKNRAWGAYKNFVFRPGINSRIGLDFKLGKIAIGAYYQYTVKDFDEFIGFYNSLVNDLQRSPADAAGTIFGYQSRFGVELIGYLF